MLFLPDFFPFLMKKMGNGQKKNKDDTIIFWFIVILKWKFMIFFKAGDKFQLIHISPNHNPAMKMHIAH